MLPEEITKNDFCRLLGVSPQALDKLERKGVFRKSGRGKYPIECVTQAYQRMSEQAAGRKGEDDTVDLATERAKLAQAQRAAVEIKNAAAKGDLVEASAVARRWDQAMAAIRSRMLSIPNDVTQALPHLTRTDAGVIDRTVRDALTQAADEVDDGSEPSDQG